MSREMTDNRMGGDSMMKYKHELITRDENLPIKIIVRSTNNRKFIPRHWHNSVEILYVLSGRVDKIFIDGIEHTANQGDIVVINSNATHSFSLDPGKERKDVTILIPYDFFKANFYNIDQYAFDCISINEKNEQKIMQFDQMRENLDEIVSVFINKESDHLAPIKITSLSYELIYILLTYFKKEKKYVGVIKSTKYLERLTRITNFIKENYKQKLSIDIISSEFGLSPTYLSRLFMKYIGTTVFDYINAIRLERSYHFLMNTDLSILQIALENGFPNEKSFNRVFKAAYHVTPSQYRKENKGREGKLQAYKKNADDV
ncbi:AraC family transcriptional regulator [Paenibacillus thiaminolyticus]|nr:AraC family transcriptional regulator [Paenibacillus thiaminolyticus]